MLEGIDDIDWTALPGAYGAAEEAPEILRALASPDPETAAEGFEEFASSLWHQGTVYPATVAAVPFLVELAAAPGVHGRRLLLFALGALCDPERSHGAERLAVHAAVAARSDALAAQLDDADPRIRECAAYAVARCGPHTRDALERRWAVEEDPEVRASLLMGIVLHEPARFIGLLRSAALSERFPVPVAAALALARAGLRFPVDTVAPIAAAFAGEEVWRGPWTQGSDGFSEVLGRIDGDTGAALTSALVSGGSAGRVRVAGSLAERFRARRSAPARLMPHLRELLRDTDPDVVAGAVASAAHAGAQAAAVSDELLDIATRGDLSDRPASTALKTLIRLQDPRWRGPVLSAWAEGQDPDAVWLLVEHVPAFDPEVLSAARRRLTAQLAEGMTGDDPRIANPLTALVNLLGAWGSSAADAVPELVSALPAAPGAVCAALAGIGPAALPAVPLLRQTALGGEIRAAHTVWRLTGDAGPLVAAGARLADSSRLGLDRELRLVADAGPAAAPLVPALADRLTGAAGNSHPERREQIAAAQVVWRATGDAGAVLPTVQAVLRAGDVPAREAAQLAAELVPEAGADLRPALEEALGNEWARLPAARALWLHGAPVDGLLEPLLAAVADPRGDEDAVALLVEMGAVAAVPRLRELVRQDERVVLYGSYDDTVWLDDLLRDDLRRAIAALEPSRGPGITGNVVEVGE